MLIMDHGIVLLNFCGSPVSVACLTAFCVGFSPSQAISNETWPRGYKTFYILNSTEHEISAVSEH